MFIEIYSKSSFTISIKTDTFILLQESDDHQFMPIVRVPQETLDDLSSLVRLGRKKVIFIDRFNDVYEIIHKSAITSSVVKLSDRQRDFYRLLIG